MAICRNCGASIDDDVKLCPTCGADVSGAQQTTEALADPSDAEQNKMMAILAYILFFVPLLTGAHNKSPFVKYHTNQGTVLFLASLAAQIVASVLIVVIIGCFLWPLFILASLVLFVMGIINAATGKMKPLPLIGKITIIK